MLKSRNVRDDPGTPVVDIRTGCELTPVEVRTGLRVFGEHPLAPLVFTDLPGDVIVGAMQKLARGEPPGIDLRAHQLSPEEWDRRQAAGGHQLRPLGAVDQERRKRRKAKKRRAKKT